jgi:hypothetical protein
VHQSPTYEEIASDFNLWQEYIDPDATMTRLEFNDMNYDERKTFIADNFGPEVPTVATVFSNCPDRGNGKRGWRTEGGEIAVDATDLEWALEQAYCHATPNWPAMVEINA